jgi:hypothetical protein
MSAGIRAIKGEQANVLATWVWVLETSRLVSQDTIAEDSAQVGVYFVSET